MARLECCHETETAIFDSTNLSNLPIMDFQTWPSLVLTEGHTYTEVLYRRDPNANDVLVETGYEKCWSRR